MKSLNNNLHILWILILLSFVSCSDSKKSETISNENLPFLGFDDYKSRIDSYGNKVVDTIHHTVPKFKFLNQDSVLINQDKYLGKIYIADFFFANCPTICPAKTRNLHKIQLKLDSLNLLGEVLILSHTIDPDNDTLTALRQYAKLRGIDTKYWDFVRGEKKYTHRLAKEGYLIGAEESETEPGGFGHTDAFVLVDRKGRLRGVYDGTDSKDNPKLISDIKKLLEND